MISRGCLNSRDTFCYVCGLFTDKSHRKSLTPLVQKAYELYFNCKVHVGKLWVPSVVCSTCANTLTGWLRRSATNSPMPFGVPVKWREHTNHATDCYFCMTSVQGFNYKTRKLIAYPDINSVSKPLPHNPVTCPVPLPPLVYSFDEEESDCVTSSPEDVNTDSDYQPQEDVHRLNYNELYDLVRDLALTKGQAELLGSRLKEYNLLAPDTLTANFRYRHKNLVQYFDMSDGICYCKDVDGLMTCFGKQHFAEEWRLFIDSSKTSLKAVLLHNGNKLSSIPVGYSAHMKETYDNMALLLDKIKYREYNWRICGDLKVIAILMGMQTGMFTEYLFLKLRKV
jgi:hypothetical protein